MKLLVVGVLLLMAHSGSSVEFEDCSGAGEVYAVDINDCPKEKCSIAIGTVANVTMKFATSVPANVITGKVYLLISDVEHDAVVRPDPCNAFDGPGCPLSAGDVRTYRAQVTIATDTPPVKADLIWTLKSENDDLIACFATRIHLVAVADGTIGHPRQRTFRSGSQ